MAVLICGCAAPIYSPVPPASRWTNGMPAAKVQSLKPKVQSPPEPMADSGKLMIDSQAVSAPRNYWLAWDYGDMTNIRFELWRAGQPQGPFGYWTNVEELKVAVPIDKPQQFFICRASNTVTRLTSDWSR